MSPKFDLDIGPFSVHVLADEAGVTLGRGTMHREVPWDRITGAVLVREKQQIGDDDREKGEKIAEVLGGPDLLARLKAMEGHMGKIVFAYRDDQDKRRQLEVPVPLDDPAFLSEFQSRLGARWLGEVADQHEAEKAIHTSAGFFKTVFILLVLLGIVAAVLLLGFFSLLGPVLNLLSIQRMLVDLQDGDYAHFATRLMMYLALFVIAYFLRRIWQSRARPAPSRTLRPRQFT